jgi:hypothetical protein
MSRLQHRQDPTPVDSVPLGTYEAPSKPSPGASRTPRLRVANYKLLLALFIAFLAVVSDVFTNNVLPCFGEKAIRGRTATTWGVVIQGLFLVLFYVLAVYLTEHQIL